MQFRGHSLPVCQSMSVSWALPCPISSAKPAHVISFDYWPLECVNSFRSINLEWHVCRVEGQNTILIEDFGFIAINAYFTPTKPDSHHRMQFGIKAKNDVRFRQEDFVDDKDYHIINLILWGIFSITDDFKPYTLHFSWAFPLIVRLTSSFPQVLLNI